MPLAGVLAEGALFFVSTLPFPFASSAMLLAPALVQLQLEYVLQAFRAYGNFKRTIIKTGSRVFSQPAGRSEDIWRKFSSTFIGTYPHNLQVALGLTRR